MPLSATDYTELLPAVWRAVNAYGIKISHRTYDAEGAEPDPAAESGVTAWKGLWEVHHDPYDVSRGIRPRARRLDHLPVEVVWRYPQFLKLARLDSCGNELNVYVSYFIRVFSWELVHAR